MDPEVLGSAQDWLNDAREELRVARSTASMLPPAEDASLWHSPQCAEKALKAVLILQQVKFPYTHSLPVLLQLVPQQAGLSLDEDALADLTEVALESRYPRSANEPPLLEAHEAIGIASAVLDAATRYLQQYGLI
jgi:HEPN domain-containing protein